MDSADPFNWPDDFEKAISDLRRAIVSTCLRESLQLADAEDVAQHVLIKLWVVAAQAACGEHKDRDLSSIVKLTRFAITIALNYIKKIRMAEARSKNLPIPDSASTPNVAQSSDEDFTKILKLIDEPAREAVRLNVLEDLSYQAIAGQMQISKTQAGNLVKRGLKQALRRLGK